MMRGGVWNPWRLVKRTTFPAHPVNSGVSFDFTVLTKLPDGRILSINQGSNPPVAYTYNMETPAWTPFTVSFNKTMGSNTDYNCTPLMVGSDGKVWGLIRGTLYGLNLSTGVMTSKSVSLPGEIASYTEVKVIDLDDGTAFIFGMRDYWTTSVINTWRLDPVTGVATVCAVLPALAWGHCACRLADGRVLLAGGWNPAQTLVYTAARIYNPVANTYTTIASLPVGRAAAKCCLLPNGDVLLQGGVDGTGTPLLDCLIYNMASNTWTDLGVVLPATERYGQAFTAQDGQVMLFDSAGGAAVSTFDPASRQMATYWKV